MASKEPLKPLGVHIEEPIRTVRLTGTTLSVIQRFESLSQLEKAIQGVYFALPTLVNVRFADPPYVERVDGRIGSTTFRWELAEWQGTFRPTTQEEQERRFEKSWSQMGVLSDRNQRLAAGLHYFHVACRLARAGSTPGEFMAEVVLNLSKTLEVLFPSGGDGRTRDAVRDGLRGLGYSDNPIQRDFIPVMALRDHIDVAHVQLGLFTMDQLQTVHAFTERVERAFSEMLERLLAQVESGETEIAAHAPGPPRNEAIRLIEQLRQSEADGAR